MACFRKPYFKTSHACWYVNLDGKNIRLMPDKDEAHQRYHELMKERKKAARFVTPGEPAPLSLGQSLEQFLASGFKGKAADTKSWYSDKLTPFAEHLGRVFVSTELKPFHVDQWISAHPDWSPGTARNQWRAVQRLCRWGTARASSRNRDPRRVVAEERTYLGNNRDRMAYPRYRQEGLPTTSSLVASLVGEVNARVKSKQKHWTRSAGAESILQQVDRVPAGREVRGIRSAGAESILQLWAGVLSQDDRLPRFFAQRPGCPFRKRDTLSYLSEGAPAQTAA